MKRRYRLGAAVAITAMTMGGGCIARADSATTVGADPLALLPGAPNAPTVQSPLMPTGPTRVVVVKTWSSRTPPGTEDIVPPSKEQLAQEKPNTSVPAALAAAARRGKNRPLARVAAWATDSSGCVNNITSYQPTGPFSYTLRGNMVGCNRGGLRLHTYIRYQGGLWQDGSSNSCSGTSCTTADTICPCAPLGYYLLVVHGWNNTGGSNYASVELLRYTSGTTG